MTRNEHIVIRSASPADETAIDVLRTIDGGSRRPKGQITLAEVDGRLRAAVGSNGASISDPFWPSAELVSMLRVHNEISTPVRRAPRFARRPALRIAGV